MDDARLLWEWRNDATTRVWFFDNREIPWEEHQQWLSRTLRDDNSTLYIAEAEGGAAIGRARFSVTGSEAEIHVLVAADQRGKGLGKALIRAACARLFRERPPVEAVVGKVLVGNTSSIRAFRAAGFREAQEIIVGTSRTLVLRLPRSSQ